MLKLRFAKPWIAVLAVTLVAATVSGCGVKGALQPPPEATVAGEATKSAESADPGSNSGVKPKPHEGFILDPLLR